MRIFKIFNLAALKAAAAATLFLAAFSVMADSVSELPTIRVNGKVMYYYDAKTGDNIYTIAEKLGVTVADIRDNNPSAADGIKPRMRLFFPTDIQTTETGDSTGPLTHVVAKGESIYGIARRYGMTMDELTSLNPKVAEGIKPGMRLTLKEVPDVAEAKDDTTKDDGASDGMETRADIAAENEAPVMAEYADSAIIAERPMDPVGIDSVTAAPGKELNVAIMLPFLLEEPTIGRQTQLYTEFYKGFLIAADSLNRPGRTPVRIHAYDTSASIDSVKAIMTRPEIAGMDMIVAPDNVKQLETITNAAPATAWILNVFAVKDSSYLTCPAIIQTNIPHDEMYARAIEGFLDHFQYATPVFLARKDGRNDKEEFTDALKQALSTRGIVYRTVNFDGYLADADLAEFDTSAHAYVFIPQSGNRDEFSRIIHGLKSLKEQAADPASVQLFGYPEWATYRGTQFDDICAIQTTIYSRYYPTENDADAQRVNQTFCREFGKGVLDKQMPVLGILGFDTGRMVIEGLRTQDSNGLFPSGFSGIQSGIRLLRAGENGGLFNNALFIITYNPGGSIEKAIK